MGEVLTKKLLEEWIEEIKKRPMLPDDWVEYKEDTPSVWHRYYIGADNKVKHEKFLIGR